jgi:hypothetical protein
VPTIAKLDCEALGEMELVDLGWAFMAELNEYKEEIDNLLGLWGSVRNVDETPLLLPAVMISLSSFDAREPGLVGSIPSLSPLLVPETAIALSEATESWRGRPGVIVLLLAVLTAFGGMEILPRAVATSLLDPVVDVELLPFLAVVELTIEADDRECEVERPGTLGDVFGY